MALQDARHVAMALAVGAVVVVVVGTPVHAAADDPAGAQQADRLEVQFGGGYVMPAGAPSDSAPGARGPRTG